MKYTLLSLLMISQVAVGQIPDDVTTKPKGSPETSQFPRIMLSSYEPNLIGYSYDNDDQEPFLDFKLSLKYPIMHRYFDSPADGKCSQWLAEKGITRIQPYIAFSGRFGQYIEVRDSSPVISKRFNPKVFLRIGEDADSHLDLEYGHESNGQRITTQASYDSLADDLEEEEKGKRSHANDFISRGWDYYGLTLKYKPAKDFDFYFSYAHYIGGLLQGEIEEYYSWEEQRDIEKRNEVDGLRFIAKWKRETEYHDYFPVYKLAFLYTTGTDQPFKYSTYRVECTMNILDMPFMIWGQTGYNSDLAQYYKQVSSYGIGLELSTFD